MTQMPCSQATPSWVAKSPRAAWCEYNIHTPEVMTWKLLSRVINSKRSLKPWRAYFSMLTPKGLIQPIAVESKGALILMHRIELTD